MILIFPTIPYHNKLLRKLYSGVEFPKKSNKGIRSGGMFESW